jgi:hypothetical protein
LPGDNSDFCSAAATANPATTSAAEPDGGSSEFELSFKLGCSKFELSFKLHGHDC